MDISYDKQINFQYRELLVGRLSFINKKQCWLDLSRYLHANGIPYTIKEAGVFFTLNNLEQSIAYQLDEIITKYEQPGQKQKEPMLAYRRVVALHRYQFPRYPNVRQSTSFSKQHLS